MAARGALAAALGIAAATILVAGCSTTVTGAPEAADTAYQPPSSAPAAPTSSAVTTALSQITLPTTTPSPPTTSSSSIRPMPPLNSTDLSIPPTTGRTPASTTRATGSTADTTIAGIDLGQIQHTLTDSHVAGVDSTANLGKLKTIVAAARAKGLALSVVSIGKKISNDDTSAISRQLFSRIGGTMLVLSPSLVSARTDQLTDAQRDKAVKAAAGADDDEQAVTKFIDSALESTGVAGSTTTTKPTKHPKVGGVDIDAVVAALGADHIAIDKGVTQVTAKQLSGPVGKAWKGKLKVYVSILAKDPSGHLYDVASAVMDQTGGTVIMASPKRYAIASSTISDAQLQKALDSASDANSYLALVRDVINSLLG